MKKFLFLLVFLSFSAFAHIEGRDPETQSLTCYSKAAQAAWGASAQIAGAPATFVYVSDKIMKPIFFGQLPMPRDGIYVSEELEGRGRRNYEQSATAGWNWAQETKASGNLEELTAILIDNFCNKERK